jgi:hypothetical protein
MGNRRGGESQSDQLKASGRYYSCRLNVRAKSLRKGVNPDYEKCAAKLAAKMDKIWERDGNACIYFGEGAWYLEQEIASGLTLRRCRRTLPLTAS